MPHLPRTIDSRTERIAREHDAAAKWLAEHDAEHMARSGVNGGGGGRIAGAAC